jgi:catechol 2,3-dioxygenase-like lactoylglutathione lyase family enzyme
MLSHVVLGTNDITRSRLFYETLLPTIGLELHLDEQSTGWIGYSRARGSKPEFLICRPIDKRPATSGMAQR